MLSMRETCEHCGIQFERESGYFSMAIFVAYVMASAIGGFMLLAVYLMGLGQLWYYAAPITVIVILFPILFRYGRIVWLYLDEWMDPRQTTP